MAQAVTTGWNETSAQEWMAGDEAYDRFVYPWKMTPVLATLDDNVDRVLDVASGPGNYLREVLDAIPDATGVWFDFSDTMLGAAKENLARFGDRVSYVTGDMSDLSAAGDPESFDLVTTSRATHHLYTPDLAKFYASAASRLRSGGWVANIDSFNSGKEWRARLRALSRKMAGRENEPANNNPSHPSLDVPPSLEDHLACLHAAGFDKPEMPWKSFQAGLLVAKKL